MKCDGFITVEDIRHWIMDRCVEDNDLDMDLSFSDDEILRAMQHAAREFNSVPPHVYQLSADDLPSNTNMMFDAVSQQLYLMQLQKLMRNDIDYSAGGVNVNIVAKRISHYKELVGLHGERFKQAAKDLKLRKNLEKAYGHY